MTSKINVALKRTRQWMGGFGSAFGRKLILPILVSALTAVIILVINHRIEGSAKVTFSFHDYPLEALSPESRDAYANVRNIMISNMGKRTAKQVVVHFNFELPADVVGISGLAVGYERHTKRIRGKVLLDRISIDRLHPGQALLIIYPSDKETDPSRQDAMVYHEDGEAKLIQRGVIRYEDSPKKTQQ